MNSPTFIYGYYGDYPLWVKHQEEQCYINNWNNLTEDDRQLYWENIWENNANLRAKRVQIESIPNLNIIKDKFIPYYVDLSQVDIKEYMNKISSILVNEVNPYIEKYKLGDYRDDEVLYKNNNITDIIGSELIIILAYLILLNKINYSEIKSCLEKIFNYKINGFIFNENYRDEYILNCYTTNDKEHSYCPLKIFQEIGLLEIKEQFDLEKICIDAINNDSKSKIAFQNGNEKAINSFKGYVMKNTKGQASPKEIDIILKRLLNG